MAGNKKRKNFGSGRGASGGRASSARPMTVKEKKRQLIWERIHPDEKKYSGMRTMSITCLALLLLRAALLVYELVFYSLGGADIEIVSNLLFIPLPIILLMAKDGNRGLMVVPAASAIIRIIYLFTSMYPEIKYLGASEVFVSVYAALMAAQFIISVVVLSMSSTDAYAKEMRSINMELRILLMTSRR